MNYGMIDMSQYPVVVLKVAPKEPGLQEVDDFFDQLEAELAAREGAYVTKVFGQSNYISSSVRARAGERTNRLIQRFRHRAKGSAVIISAPLGRMMIKGILQVVKQPLPIRVVGSEPEADLMVNELLAVSA